MIDAMYASNTAELAAPGNKMVKTMDGATIINTTVTITVIVNNNKVAGRDGRPEGVTA